jgi:hypothetical protein
MNKNTLAIVLCILFCLLNAGCIYSVVRNDGPYEGRIVDTESGIPIEGVVVLSTWNRIASVGAGGAFHVHYDAQEVVTDKNGEFSIKGLGLKVLSGTEPMDVFIFKAGYEYIGVSPWRSFKEDVFLNKKITWNGKKAVIPLRRLRREERESSATFPPLPPSEAPLNKVKATLQEINKEAVERGIKPIGIWQGNKI